MDFNLSEEQQLLCDVARRFVETRCALINLRASGASGSGDDAHAPQAGGIGYSAVRWQDIAAMGWPALLIPEADGGLGLSMVEAALLFEQLGGGAMREPLVSSAVLAASLIGRVPHWSGRGATLLALAEGSLTVALAHHEAGHHDLDRTGATRAEAVANGYRLIGTKSPVLWGGSVDAFIVPALEPGAAAPSLYMVRGDRAGVR